jgi:hypothetical protein
MAGRDGGQELLFRRERVEERGERRWDVVKEKEWLRATSDKKGRQAPGGEERGCRPDSRRCEERPRAPAFQSRTRKVLQLHEAGSLLACMSMRPFLPGPLAVCPARGQPSVSHLYLLPCGPAEKQILLASTPPFSRNGCRLGPDVLILRRSEIIERGAGTGAARLPPRWCASRDEAEH